MQRKDYQKNLNLYETLYLDLIGWDPVNSFRDAATYVASSAPQDYEKAIDEALFSLPEKQRKIAVCFFSTELSFGQTAKSCGATKDDVVYSVKLVRRALSDNRLAICAGPEAARVINERRLPIAMLNLRKEITEAFKAENVYSIRELLKMNPKKLTGVPRISVIRVGEIRAALKNFLSGDLGRDIILSDPWRQFLYGEGESA
jgi:hypothetical protein